MKEVTKSIIIVIMITIIGFTIVYKKADFSQFITQNKTFNTIKLTNTLTIHQNNDFNYHNTSPRSENINYIVIHYTGTTSNAIDIINYYNNKTTTEASADFIIDQSGEIYEYNTEYEERYSWAVGGEKKENLGGTMYGIVTNNNSISIELCTNNNTSNKNANSDGWILTEETINSGIILINYLMSKYDLDINNVIRHYDVTGKLCPGIIGWNEDTGSTEDWNKFLESIKNYK